MVKIKYIFIKVAKLEKGLFFQETTKYVQDSQLLLGKIAKYTMV